MNTYAIQILAVLSCLLLSVNGAEKAAEKTPVKAETKVDVKDDVKTEGKVEVKTATKSEAGTDREGRAMVTDDALMTALNDKRYLMRQLKCALGEGPCDPVGRKIKTFAPLILRGSCPKCSPTETRQIKQVLSHVQRHFPKEWNRILKQFTGQQ